MRKIFPWENFDMIVMPGNPVCKIRVLGKIYILVSLFNAPSLSRWYYGQKNSHQLWEQRGNNSHRACPLNGHKYSFSVPIALWELPFSLWEQMGWVPGWGQWGCDTLWSYRLGLWTITSQFPIKRTNPLTLGVVCLCWYNMRMVKAKGEGGQQKMKCITNSRTWL